MKRIISIAAAVAMIFGAASCQKDLAGREGDCPVSFCMEIPDDVVTKAEMSDGSNVDQLIWEVYSESSDRPVYEGVINEFSTNSAGKKQFTLELKLVTNVEYDLLFWAQKKDAGHYNTDNLKNVYRVRGNYNEAQGGYIWGKANDETRDAFYGTRLDFVPTGIATNETVELRRPFAQINFGATKDDWDNAMPFIEGTGLSSMFKLTNVPTTLNVMDGTVSGSETVIFEYEKFPNSEYKYGYNTISYNHVEYAWIGMNYIFAPKEKSTMNSVIGSFVHKGNDASSALVKSVPNVPFRQNYKTNILGQIFTGGNTFNVIIEPGFNNPDNFDKPNYNIIDPLEKVLEKGGTFSLTNDLEISESLRFGSEAKVVINLNGHTINYTGGDILFRCEAGQSLTIKGNGTINANGYIATTGRLGGWIIVEDGTFVTSDATTFQAYGGEVEIKGGTFQSEPYNGIYYTLNKIDDGTGTITVNAGRFYKYNPAESYTEPNGPVSFVPYDRKVTVDGDWYVVSYGN